MLFPRRLTREVGVAFAGAGPRHGRAVAAAPEEPPRSREQPARTRPPPPPPAPRDASGARRRRLTHAALGQRPVQRLPQPSRAAGGGSRGRRRPRERAGPAAGFPFLLLPPGGQREQRRGQLFPGSDREALGNCSGAAAPRTAQSPPAHSDRPASLERAPADSLRVRAVAGAGRARLAFPPSHCPNPKGGSGQDSRVKDEQPEGL